MSIVSSTKSRLDRKSLCMYFQNKSSCRWPVPCAPQTGPAARGRSRGGLPEPARHRLHPAESALHQRLGVEDRGGGASSPVTYINRPLPLRETGTSCLKRILSFPAPPPCVMWLQELLWANGFKLGLQHAQCERTHGEPEPELTCWEILKQKIHQSLQKNRLNPSYFYLFWFWSLN